MSRSRPGVRLAYWLRSYCIGKFSDVKASALREARDRGCSVALLDAIRYSNSFDDLRAIVDEAIGTGAVGMGYVDDFHLQKTCPLL